MYCENCRAEIGEDVNFCPKCGIKQKKPELEKKKKTEKTGYESDIEVKKKSGYLTTAIILIIVFSLLTIYLVSPETRSVPYQESYQDSLYRTEHYTEPVYGTLYYGTLTQAHGHWYGTSFSTQNFDNAVSTRMDFSGKGPDDRSEYTFTMTNYQGSESYYYHISSWEINNKAGIIRYDEKTRQIFDHYETKYRTKYKDLTQMRILWFLNN